MRTATRAAGEVLITLGAVALLFLVYQLWWTTVLSNRDAARNAEQITQAWTSPNPPAAELTESPPEGTGFALMTIPRLGPNMDAKPVIQGVSQTVLAQGLGHYPLTALPGQVGNFAVAGHRISYGEPLRDVPNLQVGDNVYVETENYWYTYRLVKTEIVLPDDGWVIDPQPFGETAPFGDRLVTLTTCEPLYGNTNRWIWWGQLVETKPKSDGAPEMTVSG